VSEPAAAAHVASPAPRRLRHRIPDPARRRLRRWQQLAIRRIPVGLRRRLRFWRVNGNPPHFRHPVTYNDWVNHRILYEHDDTLAWTCDKLRMQAYAVSCGVEVPDVVWSGVDVGELVAVELPASWILKPNHRTGAWHLGHGPADIDALRELTRSWWEPVEWLDEGEWAYSRATPGLLVEAKLGTGDALPTDYKIVVVGGRPRVVFVMSGRTATGLRVAAMSPEWELLFYDDKGADHSPEPPDRPASLEEMFDVAVRLAEPFAWMRVDLYDVDGRIVFGELTPYSASGIHRFSYDFDVALGRLITAAQQAAAGPR
jgi:hypothetical protein